MDDDRLGVKQQSEQEVKLLDCYRIALDFGLPAAEKALALIDNSTQQLQSQNKLPVVD